jgi:hypothetical protein
VEDVLALAEAAATISAPSAMPPRPSQFLIRSVMTGFDSFSRWGPANIASF